MSVSVIIPALNEASTVAGVIRACLADDPLEVLVIDADSTDETAAVARAAGADEGVEAPATGGEGGDGRLHAHQHAEDTRGNGPQRRHLHR